MRNKKVVTIGGGTGSFTLLSGLKNYAFDISAIVSMADDGGSTGKLRDELGVLPPGDVRQCLVALSEESKTLRDLFNYRFESGQLKGHTMGNLFLSALEKMEGDFASGLEVAMRILKIKGRVLPVTQDNIRLYVKLGNGDLLKGENEVYDSEKLTECGIAELYLSPQALLHPPVERAIREADIILIAPGNIYCSIAASLMVKGLKEAIDSSRAKIFYIVNLVNKKGQTDGFNVDDYVDKVNSFLGKRKLDVVLVNSKVPSPELRRRYEKQGETLVDFDKADRLNRNYTVVRAPLLQEEGTKISQADALAQRRSFIRHDSNKLAQAINYISELEEHQQFIKEIIKSNV